MPPNPVCHAASRTLPSLRHSCRGRRQAFHGLRGHRRIGERHWLSCARCVCPPSASAWLSYARLSLSARPWRECAECVRPCAALPIRCFPAECAVQPLQVVIAPLGKPPFVLHPCHVLVRTRKHDTDCPHLVGRYLPPDASRADAVAYCSGAVCHAVGELHQLTVEVGACGGCVLGRGLAFYVVGCVRVSRPFRFVDLDADISHVRFLFLRSYKLVCRYPLVCGHSRTGQAGLHPSGHPVCFRQKQQVVLWVTQRQISYSTVGTLFFTGSKFVFWYAQNRLAISQLVKSHTLNYGSAIPRNLLMRSTHFFF